MSDFQAHIKAVGKETRLTGLQMAWASVKAAAFNVALTMGISVAISLLAQAADAIFNAGKNASEAADEIADSTRGIADKAAEKVKSLDDLIKKYKELAASGNMDEETRSEVRNIQSEIADLVGQQASALNLVNGNLDEELAKLRQISAEQRATTENAQVAAYQAASEAYAKADTGKWAYRGGYDGDAIDVLQREGLIPQVDSRRIPFEKGKVRYAMGFSAADTRLGLQDIETTTEKIEVLRGMLQALRDDPDLDWSSSKIFTGLQKTLDDYQVYVTNMETAAQALLSTEAALAADRVDDNGALVNTVDTYAAYRDEVLGIVQAAPALKAAVDDGTVFLDGMAQAVDGLLARRFPELSRAFDELNTEAAATGVVISRSLQQELDKKTMTSFKNMVEALKDARKDMEGGGGLGADTLRKLAAASANYADYLEEQNGVLTLNTKAWRELAASHPSQSLADVSDERAALEAQRAEVMKVVHDLGAQMQKEFGLFGNIDLRMRPDIDLTALEKAGWDASKDLSSLFDRMFNIKDENGEGALLHITPILPDGRVLSPAELDKYVYAQLHGHDPIKVDDLGIVLKVDRDVGTDPNDPLRVPPGAIQGGKEWRDSLWEVFSAYDNVRKGVKGLDDQLEENAHKAAVYSGLYNGLMDDIVWENPRDWSDDAGKALQALEKNVQGVAEAMTKLASGTALTGAELANLVLTYPKMLEASDLFTEGSISGQQRIVQAAQEAHKQEYQLLIDEKIAELEATNVALKDQIAVEEDKLRILDELAESDVNSKANLRKDLVNRIKEYNALEAQNYATFKGGELQIDADVLEKNLMQTNQFAEKATAQMHQVGGGITQAYEEGLSGAAKAMNTFGFRLRPWVASLTQKFGAVAKAIAAMMEGRPVDTNGVPEVHTVDPNIKAPKAPAPKPPLVDPTIDGQTVKAWVDDQKEAVEKRIVALRDAIDTNLIIIENLRQLRELDIGEVFKKEDKSGKQSVQEYTAAIDECHKALKRLEDVQRRRIAIEAEVDRAEKPAARIAAARRLIGIYQEEAKAIQNLNDTRAGVLTAGVAKLRAGGFDVRFDAKTFQFAVNNLEHLNELEATSKGTHKDLQSATNDLRKETEKLIDKLDDMNEAAGKSAQEILSLGDSVKETKDEIIEWLDGIVASASDAIDALQNGYKALQQAADEYENTGYIMVDTLQEIITLGPQYLALLQAEGGQLVINRKLIQALAAEQVRQLSVESALTYVEKLRIALADGKALAVERLLGATNEATDATWKLVYANLALLNLDGAQYERAKANVDKLRSLADGVAKTIASSLDGGGLNRSDEYEKAAKALDTILDLTMAMIKAEKEQEIDALEQQVKKYKEIIDLKKEMLKASKDEGDYGKDVAKRLKEIAELQRKIDLLKLDDSREARAQQKELEAERDAKQIDLADAQADYALERQLDMLDKEKDAFEATKEDEAEATRQTISSTEKLYRLAIERINTQWDKLYDQLISWNYEYGDTLESDVIEAWKAASEAVKEYGTYLEAVSRMKVLTGADGGDAPLASIVGDSHQYTEAAGARNIIDKMRANSLAWYSADASGRTALTRENEGLARELGKMTGESFSLSQGIWHRSDGSALYTLTGDEIAKVVVREMKANSAAWEKASGTQRTALEERNVELAAVVQQKTGQAVTKKQGVWYIGSKRLFDIYHSGGIVGQATPKQNEVLALLEKGEAVLDAKKEAALHRLVDFATQLSKQLGTQVSDPQFDAMLNNLPSGLAATPAFGGNFAPQISVA